ncbi:MAG: phosphoglucomutase [Ignavibacteriaceae bacterium]|nr:phosphoglucomutase [Ignavibacteriaceae bacterium]
MNKKKSEINFGTDGWRGLLDKEVNPANIARVAQAFSIYLIKSNKDKDNLSVAIGYDGRSQSKEFATLFARVLSGNNIKVYLSEKTGPTPVVSYFVKNKRLNAGVMITASHNPPEYNGIKFKSSYGGPFLTEQTHKVESYINADLVQVSEDYITQSDLRNIYYANLERIIDFDLIKESGVYPLIDSMAGAGQQVIETALDNHGIAAKTIFKLPETDFAGRLAEPLPQNLKPLADELQKGDYSLGLATDGDADRLGVMLETGEWLSAQETILLLADYLVNTKKLSGHIAKTSSVTDKLNIFASDKRKIINVQVGFKYLCEEMLKDNVLFAAEESGGFGYSFHIPDRDGLLSGLLFVEMLAASGYNKLSELVAAKRKEYGEIFYDRIDAHYTSDNRVALLPALAKAPPESIAGYKVTGLQEFLSSRNVINGLKLQLEGDSRWLLLRSSETEPMVRLYAEGNTKKEVADILLQAQKLIFIH